MSAAACFPEDDGTACATSPIPPPAVGVTVRDAETSVAICDATVALLVEGRADPVKLAPFTRGQGECSYSGEVPRTLTVLTVDRAGYERATTKVAATAPDVCGYSPPLLVTVELLPVK